MSKREERQQSLPNKNGEPWSESEEKELVEEFADGLSVQDIAARHVQTKGAITSRLARLGLMFVNGQS